MTFFDWLKDRVQSFPGLRQRALGDAAAWRKVKNLRETLRLIDGDQALDSASKVALREEAVDAFDAYDGRSRSADRAVLTFGVGVFFLMFFVVLLIAAVVFEQHLTRSAETPIAPVLGQLADEGTARGLITFVFAVGVMSLALILTVAHLTSRGDDGGRFDRVKEVFTSLVAILGTILGFYFGAATQEDAQEDAAALEADAAPSAAVLEFREASAGGD